MNKYLGEVFGKWRYLQKHPAFQRAPSTTLARLIRWRVHCLLKIPATVNLDPWNVHFFLPPYWRGKGTTGIFALRHFYERALAY